MDSDNTDSGKEEEDDDEDGNKARLDQMLATHAKYLQMCQTSARLLQVLSGYVGAPQEAHVIELESVSDESEDVSSCSTAESSSSQTSNNDETSRPTSEHAGECVIWAEPLMSCRLVPSAPMGPCSDVRRLPPGVTPDDVKRSKAEAVKAREAARLELNKYCGTGTSSTDTRTQPNTARKATTSTTFTSTGQSSVTNTTTGNSKATCTETSTSVASSLANTQEGINDVMSQISDASETIKQAHSLLTSMGLGHYSLARRIAQINNNNTDSPSAITRDNNQSLRSTDNDENEISTVSAGNETNSESDKKNELQKETSSTELSSENNNKSEVKSNESEINFPRLTVVKPLNSNNQDDSNEFGCNFPEQTSKSSSPPDYSSKDNNGSSQQNLLKTTRTRALYRPHPAMSYTRQDSVTDLNGRKDHNVSANVTTCSWSSHFQRPTQRFMNRVANNPLARDLLHTTASSCTNRTQQTTSLAGSMTQNNTVPPIDGDSLGQGDASVNKSTLVSKAESSKITQGSNDKTQEHRVRSKTHRHIVSKDEVKRALEFAMRNVKKSGGWTLSANAVDSVQPTHNIQNLTDSEKSEANSDNMTEICFNIESNTATHGSSQSSDSCSDMETIFKPIDNEDIPNIHQGSIKRVTFVAEPTLITAVNNRILESSLEIDEDVECLHKNGVVGNLSDISDSLTTVTSSALMLTNKTEDVTAGDESLSNQSSLEIQSLSEDMNPYVSLSEEDACAIDNQNNDLTNELGVKSNSYNNDDAIESRLRYSVQLSSDNNVQAHENIDNDNDTYSVRYSPRSNVFVCKYPVLNHLSNEIPSVLSSLLEANHSDTDLGRDAGDAKSANQTLKSEQKPESDMDEGLNVSCNDNKEHHRRDCDVNCVHSPSSKVQHPDINIANDMIPGTITSCEYDKVSEASHVIETSTSNETLDNFLVSVDCNIHISGEKLHPNEDDHQKSHVGSDSNIRCEEVLNNKNSVQGRENEHNDGDNQQLEVVNVLEDKNIKEIYSQLDDRVIDEEDQVLNECKRKNNGILGSPNSLIDNEDTNSDIRDSDTEPTLTASLPDGSELPKPELPHKTTVVSKSTTDLLEAHGTMNNRQCRFLNNKVAPLRSVTSQTDVPRLGRAIKPTKYFKSLMRRPKSSIGNSSVTESLIRATESPQKMEGFANTSTFFMKSGEQSPTVYDGVRCVSGSRNFDNDYDKRHILSRSDSSTVSIIDLSEKKPVEIALPEPSLPLDGDNIKTSPRKVCWEQSDFVPVETVVKCKVKGVGGSTSSDSDDDDNEAISIKSTPTARTFWARTRRLRFRRRRRRRGSQQLGWLARSIRWVRKKLRGAPACSCLKS